MTTESTARPAPPLGEPTVGKTLPTLDFRVTDQLLEDYFEGLQLDRAAFDRGDAPVPTQIASAADNYHEYSRFAQDKGHLWMRQQWRFHRPLEVDVPYQTTATIEDIYERRDRTVVNTAVTLRDSDGDPLLTANHHQSFLLSPPPEEVQFRDPAKKEGARKFVVPEGDPIPGIDRTVSLEMCGQYFHGSKSYHTDLEASQALGFRDVVVGGRMTMSYVGHILDAYFGAPWWTTGTIDVKFTNPTWPNDHISAKAIHTGPTEDDPSREGAFAWIEKDDGTIVLIATASVASVTNNTASIAR
jgi:acyl dehydratase